ncbi:MAG TPA: hypothetical protein VK530_01235 [Candidatus Acidoferrum sp.]|nr:hypothetical protein [Candidatus Acidoferrum sp.]
MKARVVIPTAAGERVSYNIAIHHSGRGGCELRLVFATEEEPFERWLFYLLREIGAHVVTDDVSQFRKALGLSDSEPGVIDEQEIKDMVLPRHPATA